MQQQHMMQHQALQHQQHQQQHLHQQQQQQQQHMPVQNVMTSIMSNNNNNNNPTSSKPKRAKYNRNDGNVRFDMTIICDDVELISCPSVRNCFIGSYSHVRDCQLNSSTALAHCELNGVQLMDAVLHQSCKVLSGAQLNGVLMFPHSTIASQAKVSISIRGRQCYIVVYF